MMIRVDILEESEKRYQGPVSHFFILITSVTTIIVILIVLDVYLLFQNSFLIFEELNSFFIRSLIFFR